MFFTRFFNFYITYIRGSNTLQLLLNAGYFAFIHPNIVLKLAKRGLKLI